MSPPYNFLVHYWFQRNLSILRHSYFLPIVGGNWLGLTLTGVVRGKITFSLKRMVLLFGSPYFYTSVVSFWPTPERVKVIFSFILLFITYFPTELSRRKYYNFICWIHKFTRCGSDLICKIIISFMLP